MISGREHQRVSRKSIGIWIDRSEESTTALDLRIMS